MYSNFVNVRRGLKMAYIGLVIITLTHAVYAIGNITFFLIYLVARARPTGGVGRLFGNNIEILVAAWTAVGVLLVLSGNIICLVSRFFCRSVSDRVGSAKRLLIFSIVLEIIALALNLFDTCAACFPSWVNPALFQVLGPLEVICQFSSPATFLFFCKSLARFTHHPELAPQATSVQKLLLVSIVCDLYGRVLALVMKLFDAEAAGAEKGFIDDGTCITWIGVFAGEICALVAAVKFARLMKRLSDAVGRHAEETPNSKNGDAEKNAGVWEEEEDI
jgi:hypothetical protein